MCQIATDLQEDDNRIMHYLFFAWLSWNILVCHFQSLGNSPGCYISCLLKEKI